MELGQALGLLLNGILLERRLKRLGECSDRIVETYAGSSAISSDHWREAGRTLGDGGRSDLGQLDEHEVAELFDFLLVGKTQENASQVLVDLNLLEARIEKRVHALVGGLEPKA